MHIRRLYEKQMNSWVMIALMRNVVEFWVGLVH